MTRAVENTRQLRKKKLGSCGGCSRKLQDRVKNVIQCSVVSCRSSWHFRCAAVKSEDIFGLWLCSTCLGSDLPINEEEIPLSSDARVRVIAGTQEEDVLDHVAPATCPSSTSDLSSDPLPGSAQVQSSTSAVNLAPAQPSALRPLSTPGPSSASAPGRLQFFPTLKEAHTKYVPTATHIPKSARGDFARVLADTISECLDDPQSICSWVKLQILSKCILRAKPSGDRQTGQSFGGEVKLRMQRWRQGNISDLWKEAVKAKQNRKKGKKSKLSMAIRRPKSNPSLHADLH